MKKRCCKCKKHKLQEGFYAAPKHSDGLFSYCKTCQKIYMARLHKIRREEHKAKLIALKAEPCADCGIRYPHEVMEFDHVRGEKKWSVSIGMSRKEPWSAVLAEAEKCDLVCANCHRIRTMNCRL